MRQERRLALAALFAAILLLSLIGCGKKGDPIPPRVKLPLPITDLRVESSSGGVALAWSIGAPGGDIGSFKILRGVTPDGNQACPGCPQDYRPFVTLTTADDRLRRESERGFRYLDTDVREGGYYSYRIAVCNRTGQCSAPSNEAGRVHKEP
jgi:hypothetical protein